jgi:hypothetical protein
MLVLFLLHFREFDNVVNYSTGLTAQYASLGCRVLLVINYIALAMDVIIKRK